MGVRGPLESAISASALPGIKKGFKGLSEVIVLVEPLVVLREVAQSALENLHGKIQGRHELEVEEEFLAQAISDGEDSLPALREHLPVNNKDAVESELLRLFALFVSSCLYAVRAPARS